MLWSLVPWLISPSPSHAYPLPCRADNEHIHDYDWAAQHADLLLSRTPSHPSFYESAWHVLMSSTKSPGLRFRAAIHIVQERIRVEHSMHCQDDTLNLKEHMH